MQKIQVNKKNSWPLPPKKNIPSEKEIRKLLKKTQYLAEYLSKQLDEEEKRKTSIIEQFEARTN